MENFTIRLFRIAAVASLCSAASLTGLAIAETVAAPAQHSIPQICRSIVGVSPGSTEAAACSASLTDSLNIQMQAVQYQASYAECRQQALPMGSPALAACILAHKRQNGIGSSTTEFASTNAIKPALLPLIESSPSERRVREERACSELSLMPGSPDFSQCVAELGQALDAAHYPSG